MKVNLLDMQKAHDWPCLICLEEYVLNAKNRFPNELI